MKYIKALTVICLLCVAPAAAQKDDDWWKIPDKPPAGNRWQVRYRGGTVESEVKPDDWRNGLTVTARALTLELRGGRKFVIDPQSVTKVVYSKDDARDPKRALVSITAYALTKKRRHYVAVEFTDPEGKAGVINLQAKGDDYRTLLSTLKTVTGRPVEVEEAKEKK